MRTHCQRGHEFTPENTLKHSSDGGRRCKACQQLSRQRNKRTGRRYARVLVECPKCGDQRPISVRQELKIRRGIHSGLCSFCYVPPHAAPKPPSKPPPTHDVWPGEDEDPHEFWLRRFSQHELVRLWQSVSLYIDLEEAA